MTRIRIPYHTSALEADLPPESQAVILTPPGHATTDTQSPSIDEQRQRVTRALDRPIGSPPLETLAVGKTTATVITSDHTRPVPSRVTLPLLLNACAAAIPPSTSASLWPPAVTGR